MTANDWGPGAGRAPPERGTLYLSPPHPQAAATMQAALREAGIRAVELEPGVFAAPFAGRSLGVWRKVFSGLFTAEELRTAKCLLVSGGKPPTSAELMQSRSLAKFLNWLEGQWLTDVLHSRRLTSVFQPIVYTADPQRVYAYECLLRGRADNGSWIMPDRLFAAARGTGQMESLDCAARLAAVRAAAEQKLRTPIFVNINPNAVHYSARFLETTIAATQATGFSADRFVFEFVESEEIADTAELAQMLDVFRRHGFRVALDDVGAGYASLNVLVHVKPDFMKLDMGLIRGVDCDLYKSRVAAKLLELAQELNVKTVVEGVETVGEWQWSREHGADYAQGYLFARPDNPPPPSRFDAELLEEVGGRR